MYIAVVFFLASWLSWNTFVMKKFMLGCRFSFQTYAKKLREKATKCSLKTSEVLLDADEHVLT